MTLVLGQPDAQSVCKAFYVLYLRLTQTIDVQIHVVALPLLESTWFVEPQRAPNGARAASLQTVTSAIRP
ncbi:hypothetical protein BE20_04590 [Sorangium cellulosum]|uniref:Uncharacterized protein n=1 Tax=Sorangium cellulosum TaxID=56 RepID=A0A150T676_SORCE|nr:hypothetical protein BE20_04590 [Sorangium cellulosum]KYG00027.1 hypothetical protein BE18_50480 [Sorangium cellulosum]